MEQIERKEKKQKEKRKEKKKKETSISRIRRRTGTQASPPSFACFLFFVFYFLFYVLLVQSNLSSSTASIRKYFENIVGGPVEEVLLMRDSLNQRSRCFGFITFLKTEDVTKALSIRDHLIDDKRIHMEPARAHGEINRSVPHEPVPNKLFVGNVVKDATKEEVNDFFSKYGPILETLVMQDRETGEPRGFCFVTFEKEVTKSCFFLSSKPK